MFYLKLLLIPFLALSGFDIFGSKPYTTRWVITKGCSLKVEGTTNINKFSCIIASTFRPDTLTFIRANSSESTNITGCLKLDIREFNCHNPVMTNDLRKTLKAKEFPQLVIRLISLSRYPNNNLQACTVTGVISIELAGVTKKFSVAYTVSPAGADALSLKAVRTINFSDFNIIPPRKIGGMIQTSDKLIAELHLSMKVLN